MDAPPVAVRAASERAAGAGSPVRLPVGAERLFPNTKRQRSVAFGPIPFSSQQLFRDRWMWCRMVARCASRVMDRRFGSCEKIGNPVSRSSPCCSSAGSARREPMLSTETGATTTVATFPSAVQRSSPPEGTKTEGNYSRHAFSYTIPSPDQSAGAQGFMLLVNELTIRLRIAADLTAPTQIWNRCDVTS
jgi:hypothetical protein